MFFSLQRGTPADWPDLALAGMALTLKNLWRTLFLRQASTIQFPEQKRNTSGRYPRDPPAHGPAGRHAEVRGLLHVRDRLPRGVHRHRGRTAAREGHREVPTRFEIDLLRCVYCGFCVDACPEEGLPIPTVI